MNEYLIENNPELEEKLNKLKKKDRVIYNRIIKQMLKLSRNPQFGKPLTFNLKGKRRVHIGHFVLIYQIDEINRKIIFLEFKHHDEAYK
jgi:addiction module RelE/StbE family toxin